MRRPRIEAAAVVLLAVSTCAHAQEPAPVGATGSSCAAEPDDGKRLACYDAVFRAAHPLPEASSAPSAPVPAAPQARVDEAVPPLHHAPDGTLSAGEVESRFWELRPEDKHGTFIVRTC